MTRFSMLTAVKFVALGLSVAASSAIVSSVAACPRPSGGGYRPAPVYHQAPAYRPAPSYQPQPTFSQQPSIPPQQMFQGQPGGVAQAPQGQSFQPQPGQPQPGQPQPGQPQPGQQQPGQQQPFQQAPGSQQPVQQTAPAQQQPIAQQAPTQQPPVTPAQPQAPAQDASATLSALQILSGMAAPQPTAQSQPQTDPAVDPRVGTWIATLGNGATIRLELRADGSFVWTAVASGKTNSFQGSYTLGSDSLTLTRSNDSQQLAGKIAVTANGFNFKLDGASDAGVDFVRG